MFGWPADALAAGAPATFREAGSPDPEAPDPGVATNQATTAATIAARARPPATTQATFLAGGVEGTPVECLPLIPATRPAPLTWHCHCCLA